MMNFEELYLLHPPLDFDFIFWDGFQLESILSGRNLVLIEDVLSISRRFECKRCSFGLVLDFVIFWAVFTIARLL